MTGKNTAGCTRKGNKKRRNSGNVKTQSSQRKVTGDSEALQLPDIAHSKHHAVTRKLPHSAEYVNLPDIHKDRTNTQPRNTRNTESSESFLPKISRLPTRHDHKHDHDSNSERQNTDDHLDHNAIDIIITNNERKQSPRHNEETKPYSRLKKAKNSLPTEPKFVKWNVPKVQRNVNGHRPPEPETKDDAATPSPPSADAPWNENLTDWLVTFKSKRTVSQQAHFGSEDDVLEIEHLVTTLDSGVRHYFKSLRSLDPNPSRPSKIPLLCAPWASVMPPRAAQFPHPLRFHAGHILLKQFGRSHSTHNSIQDLHAKMEIAKKTVDIKKPLDEIKSPSVGVKKSDVARKSRNSKIPISARKSVDSKISVGAAKLADARTSETSLKSHTGIKRRTEYEKQSKSKSDMSLRRYVDKSCANWWVTELAICRSSGLGPAQTKTAQTLNKRSARDVDNSDVTGRLSSSVHDKRRDLTVPDVTVRDVTVTDVTVTDVTVRDVTASDVTVRDVTEPAGDTISTVTAPTRASNVSDACEGRQSSTSVTSVDKTVPTTANLSLLKKKVRDVHRNNRRLAKQKQQQKAEKDG